MADVTIPEAAAAAAAELLRRHKDDIPTDTRFSPLALADALEPRPLRAELIRLRQKGTYWNSVDLVDEMLAAIRHHVLGLPTATGAAIGANPQVRWVPLPDLMHLLRSDDD